MILLLQIFSTAYIIFFVALLIIGLLRPFHLTHLWYVLVGLLALCMAFWGFCLIPDPELDLHRLEKYVQSIRDSSLSVALGTVSEFGNDFSGLICFNALCYLVSLLPNTGSWLSFFAVLITISLLFPVLISYLRSEGLNSRALLPAILVIFMGMQLHYVFSGVRNAMAVAFAITGLYLFFYKKKHKLLALILLALSPTIHPSTLILLPVVLVSGLKGQLFWRTCGLLTMPVIFMAAEYLQNVPISFISYVGTRILFYSDNYYLFDRPEMIANIVLFITVGGTYWLLRKCEFISISKKEQHYANAYYFLGFVMLGCSVRRDFALRIGYLMGIAAVPLLCRIYFRPWDKPANKLFTLVLVALAYCILACCAKVYYDIFYVMSQWEFL